MPSQNAIHSATSVFAHISDQVSLFDTAGRLTYTNESWRACFGAPDPENPTVLASIVPASRAIFLERVRHVARHGESLPLMAEMLPVHGGAATLPAALCPLPVREQTLVSLVVAVSKVVTGQGGGLSVGTNEALRTLKISPLTYLGGMVHDINNLLTSALGCSGILAEHPHENKELIEDAAELQMVLTSASKLMHELSALCRGEQHSELSTTSLNRVVNESRHLFERSLGGRGQLEVELEPRLWPVHVDPIKVQQILVNLILNARDAISTGGLVQISTRNVARGAAIAIDLPANECVCIAVTDNGQGMSHQTAEQIFEPQYSTKSPNTNSGLGLTHSLVALDELGGIAEVYTHAGAGTSFRLYFPAATANAASEFELPQTDHSMTLPAKPPVPHLRLVAPPA